MPHERLAGGRGQRRARPPGQKVVGAAAARALRFDGMIAFDRRRRRLPRVPVVSKYVEYVGELWRADEASTARSDVVEVGRGTTLATRVTTGVGLGLLFTYWTMVPNWAFALGMLLQALVAQLEYFRMAIIRGARPARRIVMAASIAAMAVAAGAPALHELDISTSLMGLFYTAYLPSFWVRLRCAPEWTMAAANLAPEGALASVAAAAAAHVPLLRHAGAQAVWWTALTVAVSDIGAYFGGKRFGRHSLAALGLGAAAEAGVGFGVTIAMLALLGDLTASMLKRDAGVKDFGHLFPGHGGVLDRLDGCFFVAPIALVLLPRLVAPGAWVP
ncbi:hypothetical protein JL722_10225 [Aureococcus anophagefferens]|nr:hypothetical protein JL722_10225 [Aureococcus anophagefferens]